VDASIVNPQGLRSFAAEELPENILEQGFVDMSQVVLPGGGHAAQRRRALELEGGVEGAEEGEGERAGEDRKTGEAETEGSSDSDGANSMDSHARR